MSSELGTSTLSPYAPPYNDPRATFQTPQFHFGAQSAMGCFQATLNGSQTPDGYPFYAAQPQYQGNYAPTLAKTGQAFSQHVPQANMQVQHGENFVNLQCLNEQLAWAIHYNQQQTIVWAQQQINFIKQQISQSESFHHSHFLPPSKPLPTAQGNSVRGTQVKRSPQKSKGLLPSKNPPSLQLNSNEPGLPPRHTAPLRITPLRPENRSRSLDTRVLSSIPSARSLSPSYSLPDRCSVPNEYSFDDSCLVDAWMKGLIKTDGVFQENLTPNASLPTTCIDETYESNTTKAKFSIDNQKATMSVKHKHTAVQIKTTITNGKDRSAPLQPLPQHYPELVNVTAVTTKLFEALKIHPCRAQVLLNFLKGFPKNDLHNHLTGSIYLEEYLNFAVEIGLFYDPIACVFHSDKRASSILAKSLRDQPEYKEHFKKFRDIMSVHGCSKTASVTDGHKHFFDAFKTIESLTAHMPLDKQIIPVVRHARNQEVKYLELMIERLPSEKLPDGFEEFFNQNTRFTDSGLNIDPKVMECLKPWIDGYVQEQQKILEESNAAVSRQLDIPSITKIESPIVVKYLLEIMRDLPNHIFFARVAAAMALIQNYPHTVGLNIVGPEDDPLAVNNFQDQMKILNALYEINGRPNISLHAGEFNPVLASPNMHGHISASILAGAKRIGHGVALDFEELPGVLNLMQKNNVAVEVCLTSNKRILKVKSKDHPIKTYLKYGIPVIISTDDEAINRSSLTNELMRAVVKYNLSYEAIRKMAFDGVLHSFLPENTKQALLERINRDINNFETSISQTIKKVLDHQLHLQQGAQSPTARTYKALTV